jgi:hypothetical protein
MAVVEALSSRACRAHTDMELFIWRLSSLVVELGRLYGSSFVNVVKERLEDGR